MNHGFLCVVPSCKVVLSTSSANQRSALSVLSDGFLTIRGAPGSKGALIVTNPKQD